MLRSSLLPSLLELLRHNKHRELPQKIFEIGQVIREHSNSLSLGWLQLASKGNFSMIKTIAESIAKRLGIVGDNIEFDDPIFVPGRCVRIETEKGLLTYGEIHPETLEKFDLGYPAIGGEIYW